ncbi:MAG: WYL domain-containing transcriptional regulator [Oscillibacter sp.]|nr:WYL domain-containing transcriptional regulator [Oscillibacter sp.]
MDGMESKKLALIRIWQILKEYSDYDHPLTQAEIAEKLGKEYGIVIERKAIGRNLSLLEEAGVEIEQRRAGCYLAEREFEDSELHMLIDGVLSSKHITARHSKDLIERLCALSNRYFRASVKHIHSVNDWSKTDNQALFYNIELVDAAIGRKKQLHYDYNKYGVDKKLHKTSQQYVSPYLMVLHNQRYYLMAYSEYWGNMVFHRLDRITNMTVTDKAATPIKSVPGYENGIDFKDISSTMPYMYTDKPERVEFTADAAIMDQIVDWFGTDIRVEKTDDEAKVKISLKTSPNAMEHWAMQYLGHVEITAPASMRERMKEALGRGMEKYR